MLQKVRRANAPRRVQARRSADQLICEMAIWGPKKTHLGIITGELSGTGHGEGKTPQICVRGLESRSRTGRFALATRGAAELGDPDQ
jgi:hypothetical protein